MATRWASALLCCAFAACSYDFGDFHFVDAGTSRPREDAGMESSAEGGTDSLDAGPRPRDGSVGSDAAAGGSSSPGGSAGRAGGPAVAGVGSAAMSGSGGRLGAMDAGAGTGVPPTSLDPDASDDASPPSGGSPAGAGGAAGSAAGAGGEGPPQQDVLECRERWAELSINMPACAECGCDRCNERILGCLSWEDEGKRSLCSKLMGCALLSGCHEWDCYCTSQECYEGAGFADGPCAIEMNEAAGGTREGVMLVRSQNDPDQPLIRALRVLGCATGYDGTQGMCSEVCDP